MKQIKLVNLKLTNFKGIKSLEVDLKGNNARIYGDNGTGKTTIFDAFVWLLFNKDSQNKSDFQIKTMEKDKVIHNLNHEVEATLLVDGKELQLKKVFKEKWTKPRGQIDYAFGGHTTDYYINEVPNKKKEYDETIAEIIDEDVFKLLTNPNEFNINMHWKDRRNLLFEIAGDVKDEDVIATDKDLSKLLDVLNGRSIDDFKKVIASKRKEINDKLKEIPTRIDEIHRNKPDISELDKDGIASQVDKLSIDIEEKNNEINTIQIGTATNDLKRKISDIDLQIASVRNEHTQNEQEALFKLKTKLQEEQSNHQILQGDVKGFLQQKKSNEQLITSYKEQMSTLKIEFTERKTNIEVEQEKQFDGDTHCPTCEQDLPTDQLEESKANFNANKSKMLEEFKEYQQSVNSRGLKLKEEVEKLQEENETLQKEIDKVTETGKKKVEDIEQLKEKIKAAESEVKPIEENEQYIKLNEEKQALQEEIFNLDQSVIESVNTIKEQITALNKEQTEHQSRLAQFDEVERANKRIKELETEEKQLAAAFEEQEQLLYLTEEFTRKKVELVTENINKKFEHARFKLFEEQINGGINETCVVIGKNGESYENINNAHRINISLDIINTLSKHYGVQAPIFVDNAEAVTKLIDIESQIISLMVSEQDKQLRIEAEDDKESEVA